MTKPIRRILVAGFSTRHVVSSAVRAGLEVCAIDNFCDQDLRRLVFAYKRFEELADLPDLIRSFCSEQKVDAVITTSGAEDLQDLPVPILGTDPGTAAKFLDKALTQQFFEENGFPVPARALPGVFPAMLKPCRGSGGWRNALVTNEMDIRSWESLFPDEPYLLQELVPGIPASVCCVADGRRAKAIAANLQILRGSDEARYGFCGSVTPLCHPLAEQMCIMAEKIASASGCCGVLGIDFLITDTKITAIEVNPRFVATLDTIERANGCNLVKMHIDACHGVLPDTIPKVKQTSIRKILFAPHDLTIRTELSGLIPDVADIPVPPASFEKGDAVISVFGEGQDEASARRTLDNTIRRVTQYIG
ncbi:MAG TPA: ATP-grasp domain-containing protein [Methanospirillum sp.]|uniref:ATP-grasp domain-containing protein n=1 Tax=Methanospirillum sp. TaxID=45200 RepID=UPI002BA5A333|nr:ATP-grasp domain-containing protein [Methanospirillum sp.]HWQ62786.1 ATP-grasp domain-containing protein [Methanospirillum sp.]